MFDLIRKELEKYMNKAQASAIIRLLRYSFYSLAVFSVANLSASVGLFVADPSLQVTLIVCIGAFAKYLRSKKELAGKGYK